MIGRQARLKRTLTRFVSTLFIISQFLAVGMARPASGIQLELGQGISFQSFTDDKTETASILAAGSIVDVPDQYRVNAADGRLSSELTLNNWLKTAGRTGLKDPHHEGGLLARTTDHTDYFYPVKVVSAAAGSQLQNYQGQTYFLALRILSRNQQSLVTTQPALVQPAAPDRSNERPPPRPQFPPGLEATANCPNGQCDPERTLAPPVTHLLSDVSPILHELDLKEHSNQRRTAIDFREISSQFARSCGFSLQSFIPIVRKYATAQNIPTEVVLSMMVQESSGRCYSRGFNGNNTDDSGLFGLNSATSRIRRCSAGEIQEMRQVQPSRLENGPQCRENPVVNLKIALAVLNQKLRALSNSGGFEQPKLIDANGKPTALALRLAVSSYNGGEGWVLKAKKDLETFNRRFQTRLDPYDWEDLRLFYLRHELSENKEQRYFGNVRERGRTSSALANLSYSENIIPRRTSPANQPLTVAELWQRFENRDY